MLRFYAASFVAAVSELHRAIASIHTFGYAASVNLAADRKLIGDALESVQRSLKELPVSRVIRGQLNDLMRAVPRCGGNELSIMAREFSNNLMRELEAAYFLMIPAQARPLYEQTGCPFGDAVAASFGAATADIAAATRCMALNEWTACVFHLMRVLEHGLRWLAEDVGLENEAIAHENWKNVIDRVEKKIREMEAEPKSQHKADRTRELSSAASQFRYFKDAWRNHVSHSRAWYDAAAGSQVWTHVRHFMQELAAIASPTGRQPS